MTVPKWIDGSDVLVIYGAGVCAYYQPLVSLAVFVAAWGLNVLQRRRG